MRKRRMAFVLALVCVLSAVFLLPAAAENTSGAPGVYSGYLFAKLGNIGTKSEGPIYYLQQWDGSEVVVIKNGMLWQRDAQLDTHLNTKVTITGALEGGQLRYTTIEPFTY